jgi:tellurite resistance protein TerC
VRGEDDAVNWFTGYVLEWLLSVDNLFVFQRIFICMGTPESQRQTALLWGILGAIFFRLVLFMLSQQVLSSFWWMHYVFGLFLIYTGIQAMRHQEDELESDTPLFTFIQERLPYVDKYHPDGAFFFMKVT